MKIVEISETITASALKVGRRRQVKTLQVKTLQKSSPELVDRFPRNLFSDNRKNINNSSSLKL